MGQNADIRETFFMECEELTEALGDGLRNIEETLGSGVADMECINAVFRSVHSIKGGAGAFGLEALVRFAHHFETALDALRSGRLAADDAVLQLFFRASDHLSDLVNAARDRQDHDQSLGADLIHRLGDLLGHHEDAADVNATATDFGFVPMAISFDLDLPLVAAGGELLGYDIHFVPTAEMYALGHDPSILLRVLSDLGPMEVHADLADLPGFDRFDWQSNYTRWQIVLHTTEPEHAVQEVFEFVEGICLLEISPRFADPSVAPALPPERSAEIPFRAELSAFGPAQGRLETPRAAKSIDGDRRDGERRLGERRDGDRRDGDSDDDDRNGPRKSASPPRATVRVELDRVDRLINVVGELVINQAMLSQCVHEAGISPRSDIGTGLDEFRNLAREIQESVMAIRAQSIKPLFQRMSRIVREASDMARKKVRLVTEGEMTEVDKTVIERLADPLTHMIRNAVDHGIEAAERRLANGKAEVGTITLSAAHRSGRVLIEVSDDGAGINRPRVRQIAIDRGLIPEDADLSDPEIDKLLFLPGFSTAATISDLSGRGVGMDVVKSAIQALGGRILIHSTPEKGTTFAVSLPLTLAVLDGMVVDVAGQTMVVPITAIVETLRPPPQDIHSLGAKGQVVAIRGAFVPIIDLGAAFGHRSPVTCFADKVLLLVETDQHQQCALAVDGIHDQRQVVIKGLEENYGHVPGVAAATILGDGKIALIIDPEETVAQMSLGAGSHNQFRALEI